MADLIEDRDLAGRTFHISDCYVWAEIYYLDSPTNYREYLPQSDARPRFGDLVMLDSEKASPQSKIKAVSVFVSCFVLVLFLLAGYLLYLAIDSF
jgi:hypothetical protein